MSNFWQRAITGIVFVGLLIGGIFAGPLWFGLLVLVFALVGYNEFVVIIKKKYPTVNKVFGYVSVVFLVVLSMLYSTEIIEGRHLWLALFPVFISPFIELFGAPESGFQRVAMAVLSVVWIAFPFASLLLLPMVNGFYQPQVAFGFFLLLWLNDTGAYLVGRSIGRHKLMPKVSPGKTWEGFLGGVISAMALAFFLNDLLGVLERENWLVIAFIVAVFSNAGDLVESLFKRNMEVKDSGNFLPGHGGVLDRFDGILLSVPLILAYLLSTNL